MGTPPVLRLPALLVLALLGSATASAQASPPSAQGAPEASPLVRLLDRAWDAPYGLGGRHLALWPSHGWYFEHARDRWQWQRARVFTTVEDLLPFAFLHGGLVPMLEAAGAVVLLPRERDPGSIEVVVDNDEGAHGRPEERGLWTEASAPGFAHRPPYREGVNPFRLGSARQAETSEASTAASVWSADLPSGLHAVHVAYAQTGSPAPDARYTVYHAGGASRFAVNQALGAGTWVFLGTFPFAEGTPARVELSNESASPGRQVSADAVRFGGGLGNVARGAEGTTSGRPRYAEASRYYQQFAGAPRRVYNPTGAPDLDYRDDFQSRGEWVNFLHRAPGTPDSLGGGLGIPVDLALAFHTDAGTTRDGSVIGTLVIHHTKGLDGSETYPDGSPRTRGQALAERVFAQIGDDLRALHDPSWTLRAIWDRPYSEATRSDVPTALLELLSHHNYQDMRFALDPGFRLDASRAIYKALGRFLAEEAGHPFVVQPLPVTHLHTSFAPEGGVRLAWQATPDPLEPSARAEAFVVETRLGAGGWDNGQRVEASELLLPPPPPGVVASYRVRAVNAGGASLPSAVVSAGVAEGPGIAGGLSAPLLVVDGFSRVAGPQAVQADSLLGFDVAREPGMPDGEEIAFVGPQYLFDANAAWLDDDSPGHGASHAQLEARRLAGNTRDFAYVHGQALLAAGRSFVTAGADAVQAGHLELGGYPVLSLLLGAQRRTPSPRQGGPDRFEALPPTLRDDLAGYLAGGGRLFVSGAHWATDAAADSTGAAFLRETLGLRWRTDFAATDGQVLVVRPIPGGLPGGERGGSPAFSSPEAFALLPPGAALSFQASPSPTRYHVPSPDGIEPSDSLGTTALRYAENGISAAVARREPFPVVAFGFPFEVMGDEGQRAAVMEAVLRFLFAD